ncbi:unnamed protein product [Thelazia callipaeda]|uniref:Uncharacterized protein n=1 Tax=Thelazia callipaeda TaxID=103827 RepID=A0A0N5DA86_THECL|nr:unnamed protein product [Thelazia callipaeda]
MEKPSTTVPEPAQRIAGRMQRKCRNTIQCENQEDRKED